MRQGLRGGTVAAHEMLDRRYRVGIVNLSTATIPNVGLMLESCTPAGNFIHLHHKLQVMDSDPPVGERDLRPSPEGPPTLWFDVVNELSKAETRPSDFMFCYSNPNIVGEVAAGTYEIALRADGGNISVVKRFRIRKTHNPSGIHERLTMEAM